MVPQHVTDPFERTLVELIESIDAMLVDQVALICGIGRYKAYPQTSDEHILLRMRYDHVTLRNRIVRVVKQLEDELRRSATYAVKENDGDKTRQHDRDENNKDLGCDLGEISHTSGYRRNELRDGNTSQGDQSNLAYFGLNHGDNKINDSKIKEDAFGESKSIFKNSERYSSFLTIDKTDTKNTRGNRDVHHAYGDNRKCDRRDRNGLEEKLRTITVDEEYFKDDKSYYGDNENFLRISGSKVGDTHLHQYLEKKNTFKESADSSTSNTLAVARKAGSSRVAIHDFSENDNSEDKNNSVDDKTTNFRDDLTVDAERSVFMDRDDGLQHAVYNSRENNPNDIEDNLDDGEHPSGDDEGDRYYCGDDRYSWSTGDLDGYVFVEEEISSHIVEESTINTPNCLFFREPTQTYKRLSSWWRFFDRQDIRSTQLEEISARENCEKAKKKVVNGCMATTTVSCINRGTKSKRMNTKQRMSWSSQEQADVDEEECYKNISRQLSLTSLSSTEISSNSTSPTPSYQEHKNHQPQARQQQQHSEQQQPQEQQQKHNEKEEEQGESRKNMVENSDINSKFNSTDDLLEKLLEEIDEFAAQLELMFNH